eukprot:5402872-Alexandrium_andersonii.AAC.1
MVVPVRRAFVRSTSIMLRSRVSCESSICSARGGEESSSVGAALDDAGGEARALSVAMRSSSAK